MQLEKDAIGVGYEKDEYDDYIRIYELMSYSDACDYYKSSRYDEYLRKSGKRELDGGDDRDYYIEEYFPNAKTDEEKDKITDDMIISEYVKDRKEGIKEAISSGAIKSTYERLYTYKIKKDDSDITLTGVCDSDFNLKNMHFTGSFYSDDDDETFEIYRDGTLEYGHYDGDDSYYRSIPASNISDSAFSFTDENGEKQNATYTIDKTDGVKVIITYKSETYTLEFHPSEITLTPKE